MQPACTACVWACVRPAKWTFGWTAVWRGWRWFSCSAPWAWRRPHRCRWSGGPPAHHGWCSPRPLCREPPLSSPQTPWVHRSEEKVGHFVVKTEISWVVELSTYILHTYIFKVYELSNYYAPPDMSFSPILSNSTHIFLHGCVGAHAVEEFVFLPVLLDDLPRALVVACEHSSHHYEVSPRAWGAKSRWLDL